MSLAESASAPPIVHQTGATPPSTASFSPPASSLVVAMVCSAFATSGNTSVVGLTDSGSHTWTQKVLEQDARTGANNSGGTIAIYESYFSSAPGSISLTITSTNSGGGFSIVTKVLTGADPTQAGVASAHSEFGATTNTTTGSLAITTTTTGSIVYGMVDDGEIGGIFTPNGSSTSIDNWQDATDIITISAFKSGITGTPGSVTLGGSWGTATNSRIALLEVIPAGAGSPSNPKLGGFFFN